MSVRALAKPELIAWARRTSGLDLDTAARRLKISVSKLRSWEEGGSQPTTTQLRKLANVVRRPLAVFFLRNPPPDDAPPQDYRRLDSLADPNPSPALLLSIREARSRREVALDLYSSLGTEPAQFRLEGRLTDDPEQLGVKIRSALLSAQVPPCGDSRLTFNFWRSAAENAGLLVFQATGVQLSEMRGFSIHERPLPVVVLNIKDVYPARSFSLFHEITHIVIQRGGMCLLDEEGLAKEKLIIEQFCNHVAGSILLPADELLKAPEVPPKQAASISDEDLESLSRRFGASKEAVLRRLVILNRVTASYYKRQRAVYLQIIENRRDEGTRSRKIVSQSSRAIARGGRSFARLVLEAFDEEQITSSDVAEYLGVQIKHLDKIRTALRDSANDSKGVA